jgi:beta-lactamase superfamily II metal-dependent hydrolase
MYDVGAGDCVLLFVPTDTGEKKVLVDCGSKMASRRPLGDSVRAVIRDADAGDGPRIDLVIATHRHLDQISGFADPAWKEVEVGEVWMPWIEDPTESVARRIREGQAMLARELQLALHGAADPLGISELALNALSNEAALETLHHGFAGRPTRRFLPATGMAESAFEVMPFPGVRAFIMGPSRDARAIVAMDPPRSNTFLRPEPYAETGKAVRHSPFPGWAISPEDYVSRYASLALDPKYREDLRRIGAGWEIDAAAFLDSAVNGTSLMLMFRVGAAHLLFPGDAQWGTWNAVLRNRDWRDLLKKTVFLKVGHHGSLRSTPREFVEEILPRDFWAMVSIKSTERCNSTSCEPLLSMLRGKSSKIACSDEVGQTGCTGFTQGDGYLEAVIPI